MWTLNWSFSKNNAIDEFTNSRLMDRSIGIFLPNGFCVIGLYWFYLVKEDYINQYLFVVANNAFGVWYDEEADLYNTSQYQAWNFIKRMSSSLFSDIS